MSKLNISARFIERDENGFTPDASKRLDEAIIEIQNKNNLSPAFDQAEKAISWLNKRST